mgnify:CR=1 FL=1|tara:strand:+ start:2758 stop:4530 length:1773 start_codon:yes stop_codon:yes gene_type:complete
MGVQAYITAGDAIIPVLLPDAVMQDTARQIGIPDADLFRVDVPVGMTQHTRASFLIASTQMTALYAVTTVSLTLEDSSGLSVVISGLYARPPQPFFWAQQGGAVLVELVDERWYWQFSSAAVLNIALAPTWSSDGRWQVNSATAPTPITTYTQLLTEIGTAASGDNLTAPVGFTVQSPEYMRRLSDLYGSPNVSLATVLDAVAVANQQIIVSDGTATRFISRSNLKAQYNLKMVGYKTAMRGGMQPVNGAAASTDALVSLYNANGFNARAPLTCSTVFPQRMVEGLTYYDNCTIANVPASGKSFTTNQVYAAGDAATFVRSPNDIGAAYITDASIVVQDNTGAVLTTSPGWNTTPLSTKIRSDYADRNSNIPFGRTVWAGWIPWYLSSVSNIGQLGNVSYRLAVIDGEWSPYTISSADETDWRFGLQGTSWSEPRDIITAKGNAQTYRNCVGATIIDVPPPMCRSFPAKITGNEAYGNWRWAYSFVEVEPNPTVGATPSVSIGGYARTAAGGIVARNMAENGNTSGSRVAPGVLQSHYSNATIEALPICTDTIVHMVEQFPTSYTTGVVPVVPQYWFSMPNAVKVTCITP